VATAHWYPKTVQGLLTGGVTLNWTSDTIKVSLHTASYTPAPDTDDFFNDATNELSGGNYAQQTLASPSVNYDSATDTIQLRAANTTFANLTGAFRYAVVWKDTAGASSTDPLLGYIDLGAQSVTGTDVVIDWNDTDGVLKAVTA
jgi:hypothetical protein